MIRLVEYIVQAELSSEEKSRIRRNLEFLHPTTVSKAGMEGLFQTIMQFPSPKPRTIEKDIKIFQWDTLVAGLNKVLDKYSWVTVQQQSKGSTDRSPSHHPPSQAQPSSRLRKRRRLESGSPPASKVHDTPQLEYSVTNPFDDPASVDRLRAPNDLRQSQAMHVDPLLLHARDPAITFPTPGNASPNLGSHGDAAIPHFYAPQASNGGSQPLAYNGEAFHHFDFLGPQQNLREHHIAHPGMIAQFC
ncbi:hypothetical protein BGW80DRAFT_708077 [Lactifluus volemus]|nr:hypothetical protein BGW80DRAFT_708077 [Lactifluus volemus]